MDVTTSSLVRLVAEPARAHRRALAVSCGLSVLQVGAELARPWPLALAVDWAIDRRDVPAVLAAVDPALLLVGAGVATLLASAVVCLLDLGATRGCRTHARSGSVRICATTSSATACGSRCAGTPAPAAPSWSPG